MAQHVKHYFFSLLVEIRIQRICFYLYVEFSLVTGHVRGML